MRAIVVLLITSTATVVSTWLSLKVFGFIGAWVFATAIIFIGAYAAKGKSYY